MRRTLLIPAAGRSVRMGGVDKELLPIATRVGDDGRARTTVPVLSHAFQCGAAAGVDRATVIVSAEKAATIMNAVAGFDPPFPVSYVHQSERSGLGGAVACGAPEIAGQDDAALLLMPDTIVLPTEAPAAALAAVSGGATVAVTLHRHAEPERFGVAQLDGEGKLTGFVDKPSRPPGPWIWTSVAFGNAFLAVLERAHPAQGEWGLTEALSLAAGEGLVEAVFVEDGAYHDVGTFEGYLAALADLGELPASS